MIDGQFNRPLFLIMYFLSDVYLVFFRRRRIGRQWRRLVLRRLDGRQRISAGGRRSGSDITCRSRTTGGWRISSTRRLTYRRRRRCGRLRRLARNWCRRRRRRCRRRSRRRMVASDAAVVWLAGNRLRRLLVAVILLPVELLLGGRVHGPRVPLAPLVVHGLLVRTRASGAYICLCTGSIACRQPARYLRRPFDVFCETLADGPETATEERKPVRTNY